MTFNCVIKKPVIGNEAGVYFVKNGDNPSENGVYVINTTGQAPVYMGSDTNLNGTHYVMVYATGTPEENGEELLAAYNLAKTMPRFIGGGIDITTDDPVTVYKGQVFLDEYNNIGNYCKATNTIINGAANTITYEVIPNTLEYIDSRTTILLTPGKYKFTETFKVDTSSIDIVSLTGNRDCMFYFTSINHLFSIEANDVFIKGISTANCISIMSGLQFLRMENCQGGTNSFSSIGGDLGGNFYKCDVIGQGFLFWNVSSSLKCIDCTANYGFSSEGQGGGYMGDECFFIRCKAGSSGGYRSFSIDDFNNFSGDTPRYISCVSDSFDNTSILQHPRIVSYCFTQYYTPAENVDM